MKKAHAVDPEVQAATEAFAAQVTQYDTMARSYYRPRAVTESPASPPQTPSRASRTQERRVPEWPGVVIFLFAIVGFVQVISWLTHLF